MSKKKSDIPPEFLNSFSMDNEYSPVQLQPDEEPVKLIRCSTGYWVMLEYGEYLKDEKRKLIVIPEKEAKLGRARYLLNFSEQIANQKGEMYENAIQEEIARLKNLVDIRTEKDLEKMREIFVLAGRIKPEGLEALLISAVENTTGNDPFQINNHNRVQHEAKKKLALELATDDLWQAYECMQSLHKAGEYATLYNHFFQDGLPQLASFDHNNPKHQAALIKNFHKDKIMATIDEITSKDHLYMVAKFNIDKK